VAIVVIGRVEIMHAVMWDSIELVTIIAIMLVFPPAFHFLALVLAMV